MDVRQNALEELRELSEIEKYELRKEKSIAETYIPDFEQGASENIRVDELLKGLKENYNDRSEESRKLQYFMNESLAPYLYFRYRYIKYYSSTGNYYSQYGMKIGTIQNTILSKDKLTTFLNNLSNALVFDIKNQVRAMRVLPSNGGSKRKSKKRKSKKRKTTKRKAKKNKRTRINRKN